MRTNWSWTRLLYSPDAQTLPLRQSKFLHIFWVCGKFSIVPVPGQSPPQGDTEAINIQLDIHFKVFAYVIF